MASFGKFESLIPITTAQRMSVTETTPNTGATNADVAAADYYLTSTTSLLTAVKTALDAVSGNSTYTVSLDDTNDSSTGKVTISAAGVASFAIDWTAATSLRDILGFTGNLTGAATYTGDNQALYLHLPGCGRSNAPNPLADNGTPISEATIVFAPGSDVSYAMAFGTSRTIGSMEFQHLLGSNTWTSLEVVTNESLQTFWTYSIRKGYPVRWYADRNVDGTYITVRFLKIKEFGATPLVPSWLGAKSLWRWMSDYVKYTP